MVSRRRRAARERRATSCADPSAACGGASIGIPSAACGGASGWGVCAPTSDRGSVLLTLIAHQHLIAQLTPNRLIDLGEPRLKPDLGHVSRSWQINVVGALDRARSSG